MAKKTKDTGVLTTYSKDEIEEQLIVKLREAATAWEEGKADDVVTLVDEAADLVVGLQTIEANEGLEATTIFPGIGAHLQIETELGKQIVALKDSAESKDLSAFAAAVSSVNEQISTSVESTDQDGEGEEGTEGDGEDDGTEGDGETSTEEGGTEGETTSTEESGGSGSEESQAKSSFAWGEDLSADHQVKKSKAKAAQEAKRKQEKVEKAASYKEEAFSWDNIKGGYIQSK